MRYAICMAAIAAASALALPSWAKGVSSHVCVSSAPPPPVAASPHDPQAESALPAPPQPLQMMGCLDRDYPLGDIRVDGARRAVAIIEEPGSIAATFAFRTTRQRDALVAEWMKRWAPAAFTPSKTMTLFIAGWTNASWRLPDGGTVHAMYPEKAASGLLCIVRANTAMLDAALPILNNWCMDTLDLWRNE